MSPLGRPCTFSVYARHGTNGRVLLRRFLPTLTRAIECAQALRAQRFHHPDRVFIVDDSTTAEVDVPIGGAAAPIELTARRRSLLASVHSSTAAALDAAREFEEVSSSAALNSVVDKLAAVIAELTDMRGAQCWRENQLEGRASPGPSEAGAPRSRR
jgi:hypothetical protein